MNSRDGSQGKVMMEGDEWRRFRNTVDSGAGIEAIKLLRIFWTPSMHVSLAEVVKRSSVDK